MENIAAKHQRQFLITWSGLNLLGWIIGIVLVVLIQLNLEDLYEFSAWKTFLIWFPLGASIGLFQWFKLRLIGINALVWTFLTALGGSILVTLFAQIANFSSVEYLENNIPSWVEYISAVLAMPMGGLIIGGLQSFALRNHISKLGLWIRAYIFGLTFLAIAAFLGIFFKSYLLNLLYFMIDPLHSFDIWVFFVEMRWVLF